MVRVPNSSRLISEYLRPRTSSNAIIRARDIDYSENVTDSQGQIDLASFMTARIGNTGALTPSVSGSQIVFAYNANSIMGSHIDSRQIAASHIILGSLTSDLFDPSVTLTPGSGVVDTAHLANLAVTNPKIGNRAVYGDKIGLAGINASNLFAAQVVDANAIKHGDVGSVHLGQRVIEGSRIALATVQENNLHPNVGTPIRQVIGDDVDNFTALTNGAVNQRQAGQINQTIWDFMQANDPAHKNILVLEYHQKFRFTGSTTTQEVQIDFRSGSDYLWTHRFEQGSSNTTVDVYRRIELEQPFETAHRTITVEITPSSVTGRTVEVGDAIITVQGVHTGGVISESFAPEIQMACDSHRTGSDGLDGFIPTASTGVSANSTHWSLTNTKDHKVFFGSYVADPSAQRYYKFARTEALASQGLQQGNYTLPNNAYIPRGITWTRSSLDSRFIVLWEDTGNSNRVLLQVAGATWSSTPTLNFGTSMHFDSSHHNPRDIIYIADGEGQGTAWVLGDDGFGAYRIKGYDIVWDDTQHGGWENQNSGVTNGTTVSLNRFSGVPGIPSTTTEQLYGLEYVGGKWLVGLRYAAGTGDWETVVVFPSQGGNPLYTLPNQGRFDAESEATHRASGITVVGGALYQGITQTGDDLAVLVHRHPLYWTVDENFRYA